MLSLLSIISGGAAKAVPRSHLMKIPALKEIFVCVLAFTCVFSYAVSASAHGKHANASKETVTAGKAGNSRSALREFVLHAKAHWEIPIPREQSLDFWRQILQKVQRQGDWKSGSTYLILVDKQGRSIAHGYYESAPGHDITVWRDARGTDVVQKLIDAAQADEQGGIVDYYWDDPDDPSDSSASPKSAYAVNYTVRALGIELVLIGGLHHEEVVPTMLEVLKKYEPEVKASAVKDPETLKNFVEKAAEFVNHVHEATQGNMDITNLLAVSNRDKAWNHNEIYLFAITKQGLAVFNGHDPDLVRTLAFDPMNVIDGNDLEVGREMVRIAENGGGFIYYLWDNPMVEGDEINEVGKARGTSFKVGYVKKLTLGDDIYILGSGFYPEEGEEYLTHLGHDHDHESRFTSGIITVCLILLLTLGAVWWRLRSSGKGE